MNKAVLTALLVTGMVVTSCATTTSDTLTLNSSTIDGGELLTVSYDISSELSDSAWIGLIPQGIGATEEEADSADVAYVYVEKGEGEVMLATPKQGGSYEVRLYSADSGTDAKLLARTSVVVTAVQDDMVEASITLTKTTFTPGEEIEASFTASNMYADTAWIGLVPSDIAHGDESLNDEHDVAYLYLNGETEGLIGMMAPEEPGTYDLRLHTSDTDGEEVATSKVFTVTAQ